MQEEIPDEALLEIETRQLKNILDKMSLGDKSLLLMKYQDDMSIKEMAVVLNKSESAVKMKLKRAKEKAQQLKDELFTQN